MSKAKKMTAKYPGTCYLCATAIAVGEQIVFDPSRRKGCTAMHVECCRADVLPAKIFAAGMKEIAGDCIDQPYYAKVEAELKAELAACLAKKQARIDAATKEAA